MKKEDNVRQNSVTRYHTINLTSQRLINISIRKCFVLITVLRKKLKPVMHLHDRQTLRTLRNFLIPIFWSKLAEHAGSQVPSRRKEQLPSSTCTGFLIGKYTHHPWNGISSHITVTLVVGKVCTKHWTQYIIKDATLSYIIIPESTYPVGSIRNHFYILR